MSYINMNINYDMYNTPLPNIFIDNYMPYANPTYTVIYIFFFRNCISGNKSINTKDISSLFHILESDIINALKYWENKNLITLNTNNDKNIDISFIIPNFNYENNKDTKDNLKNNNKTKIILDQKPIYSPKELEIYKDNSQEVKELFYKSEKILGKLLSSNDLSTLFSFYDWLRLPLDVIEILLKNCVLNGHKSIRYIESVAIEWTENGINTKQLALEYIQVFNRDFKQIMKAFGQNNRNPTTKEIDYMKKWLYNYDMPINIILEACDKTITQIGQPKFNYTDKIINEWYIKKVKTIDDIKNLEKIFQEEKENKNKLKQNNHISKKNKFINYDQPSVDFDELEKLEFEYINNSLENN